MSMISVTARIEAANNPEAERFAALNREATAAKRAGDLTRACELLCQAKAIEGDQYADTRLAKFLQQAGRLDEALAEIQWLLDHSQAHVQGMEGGAAVVQYMRVSHVLAVHDAALMICKRAGRTDLQAQYAERRERYAALHKKLKAIAGVDW